MRYGILWNEQLCAGRKIRGGGVGGDYHGETS